MEYTILDDPTVHTVLGDSVALRFGDCKWFRLLGIMNVGLEVYKSEKRLGFIGLLVTQIGNMSEN